VISASFVTAERWHADIFLSYLDTLWWGSAFAGAILLSCPLRQARSMSYSKSFRCFGAAVLLAFILAASAEEIRLDALKIPVVISGSSGPASVALEAIVVRADDGLPHPLAVLNHGSPRTAGNRPTMSPYRMWAQAVAFARRGWVAVAFMRRGYGRSEGGWAENYGSCSNPDYATAGRAGASDIAAVAQFMTTQPYVSKGKWISVGVSGAGPSLKRARMRWVFAYPARLSGARSSTSTTS
jgi:hypothetical protein